MESNNKYYVSYFVPGWDEYTERQYQPDFEEGNMSDIKIYTAEEQQDNYDKAMARLEKVTTYIMLATLCSEIIKANESAKENGDFLFPYDEEGECNMADAFWARYRERKAHFAAIACEKIDKMIELYSDDIVMLKKINRLIYAKRELDYEEHKESRFAIVKEHIANLEQEVA